MGVLTKIRNKAVDAAKKAAGKGADAISALSQLSPSQVRDIDDKRQKYLLEMPSMDDEAAEELTKRNLGAISVEINNSYLPQISSIYLPISEAQKYEGDSRIAYFEVTKWVKDPNEDNIEKLMNVYQVLSDEDCNIALIYNRTKSQCRIYFAVVNNNLESDPSEVESYKNRLLGALKGNFPGSSYSVENNNEKGFGVNIPSCLKKNSQKNKSVACVSNIATEKSEKFVSQTIEKILDGIVPKDEKDEYTIVLLATPILEQEERINRLYELYTALAPYSTWQTNFTFSEMNSVNSSASFGMNIGASAGTQSGVTQSRSNTNSHSDTVTKSVAESNTQGIQTGDSESVSVSGGPSFLKAEASASVNHSQLHQNTNTSSVARGIAKTVANTATDGKNKGINLGFNAGVSFSRSSNVTATLGKNEGITQSFTNYGVKHTLENLEKQVKRLEESAALGLWDFAAYVISENSIIANNVAHTYMALTQGDESHLAKSSVNLWRADLPEKIDIKHEKEQADAILTSLSRLQHPEFCLSFDENSLDKDFYMYPSCVTPTVSLSGKELARALNFPSKSVCGIPVIETASFGRNVSSYNKLAQDIEIGKAYHMHSEENFSIALSKNSLTSHVFVTGSTGSGKTNTVVELLKKAVLENNDPKTAFLVIEPAKGEYKHILGSRDDVSVYGTNPDISPLLRINPFSFPKEVHVLEHLDRLVEIFNVCWPMYAAMPAVLKNAVEKSYEDCGWDLTESKNIYGENLYPQFFDVARNVKTIIDSSEYDTENKGAYKGSLLTRLNSLTNGINGLIFTDNELSMEALFDKNVIADLSRVGSNETKSLIMGMLILKLQEYRMSQGKMNAPLSHITVLEEAHNLLKRTSTEQSSETANLLGKSVEMISNAIAEMRTYGEGFIIADQSPGLLDMAAIRNTNTKIIMRLPDITDRELVGKAANLNESQITELAKLPCGVAAIYQNEWIQPVLCKVEKHNIPETFYKYHRTKSNNCNRNSDEMISIANLLSNGSERMSREAILKDILPKLQENGIRASVQVSIAKHLENPPKDPRMTKLAPIMSALFPEVKSAVISAYNDNPDASEWTNRAEEVLKNILTCDINDKTRRDIIQAIITDYVYIERGNLADIKKWAESGGLQ